MSVFPAKKSRSAKAAQSPRGLHRFFMVLLPEAPGLSGAACHASESVQAAM
jgi:hypothetical protein